MPSKRKRPNNSFKKYFTNQLKTSIRGQIRNIDKDKIETIKAINNINDGNYKEYFKSNYTIENDINIIKTDNISNWFIEDNLCNLKCEFTRIKYLIVNKNHCISENEALLEILVKQKKNLRFTNKLVYINFDDFINEDFNINASFSKELLQNIIKKINASKEYSY